MTIGFRTKFTWRVFLGGLAVGLLASRAAAEQRYTIEFAPVPEGCPGFAGIVSALNDSGQAVITGGCGAPRAFAWTPSTKPQASDVTIIPLPQKVDRASASGIDAYGRVVGQMNVQSLGFRAYLYDGTTMQDLGVLSGLVWSGASALNSSGLIVGFSSHPVHTAPQAVKWTRGGIDSIKLPLGPYSEAYDVNQQGTIVGVMGSGAVVENRAFAIINGKAINIGPIPGGLSSVAVAVNGFNQVAVTGLIAPPANPDNTRSFIWENGQFTPILGPAGFPNVGVTDINDRGEAIGTTRPVHPTQSGPSFIWRDGVTKTVNPLIDAPFFVGVRVDSLNNSGQIGCIASGTFESGIDQRPAILTPTPCRAGDVNCDNAVNIDDWTAVILRWGGHATAADLDGNGMVDASDLLEIVFNWDLK